MRFLRAVPWHAAFFLFMLVAVAQAAPLAVEQGQTLRILADGETVMEAVAIPDADLARLRAFLTTAEPGKVASSGASISCGPVTLVVNSEIAKRWGAEPVPLAATFAANLRGRLAPGLSWGRGEQVVPLGEARDIAIKLPSGINVNVAIGDATVAKLDSLGGGRYRLTGLAYGNTFLTATASNGRTLPDLPVSVRPWAAKWENGPGKLEFTGPTDTKRIQTVVDRWFNARSLVGAQVSSQAKPGKPGEPWIVQATASAKGAIAVEQTFKVEVSTAPAAAFNPAEIIMLSNHPEKIFGEGILFKRKATAANYRIMWHHRNDPEGVERFLVLQLTNPNPTPRKFRLIWSSYGPSADEIHVGHTAALTYATAGMSGNGETITLPANGTRTVEIRRVKPSQTMSGVAYLSDVTGAKLPLELTVSAALPFTPVPAAEVASRDPGRTASGVFPAQVATEASHTLGGPFTYLEYGGEPYVKDVELGHPSYGNFGTMYRTRLVLNNPSDGARQAFIGFSAPGGAARGVLLLDGTLYDLPMGRSGDGVPVATVTLEPGEVRQIDLELFPQAGSNYPIRLIVRSNFERREPAPVPAGQAHDTRIP